MREETLYYAEGNPFPYLSKSAAEEWERKAAERRKHWLENTADARYDQLLQELKNCQYIPPGTITTCSYDAIRIKGMVRVCQEFAQKYKEFLNYY